MHPQLGSQNWHYCEEADEMDALHIHCKARIVSPLKVYHGLPQEQIEEPLLTKGEPEDAVEDESQ